MLYEKYNWLVEEDSEIFNDNGKLKVQWKYNVEDCNLEMGGIIFDDLENNSTVDYVVETSMYKNITIQGTISEPTPSYEHILQFVLKKNSKLNNTIIKNQWEMDQGIKPIWSNFKLKANNLDIKGVCAFIKIPLHTDKYNKYELIMVGISKSEN